MHHEYMSSLSQHKALMRTTESFRDKAMATRANKRRSHGSEGDLLAMATAGADQTMRRRPSD